MKKHKKVSISDKKVLVSEQTYLFDKADYLMKNNGFSCGFNMPPALSGEQAFSLPPYRRRAPFLVDKYPACPKNWMRSEGKTKSYFVPVVEDSGMWLDLNANDEQPHHVAILISIQGVNPITGLPCNDAHLEQYIEECPKHKVKFGPDRYCSKCDYQWPKQNYLSTTGTPSGKLWLDGFRAVNGVVRQYILTAEKMRGVASNIIGKDRVYAVGLSFFVSKEKRPPKPQNILRGNSFDGTQAIYGSPMLSQPMFFSPVHTPINWQVPNMSETSYYTSTGNTSGDNTLASMGSVLCCGSGASASNDAIKGLSKYSDVVKGSGSVRSKGVQLDSAYVSTSSLKRLSNGGRGGQALGGQARGIITPTVQTKKLEVGAGAKISQQIYDDPEKLCFWHDEPEAIICINYATEKDVAKILDAGEVDVEGSTEGFLKEVPVGN